MQSFIQKWGNSLGVRIPGPLARQLRLRQGSPVELADVKGKLVIQKTARQTLKQKLKAITKINLHDEVSTDKRLGNEAW